MIGKSKEGGYILGIPGFYGEKNMAEMFGFPEFSQGKSRADIGNKRTDFWLLVQKSDINAVVKIL